MKRIELETTLKEEYSRAEAVALLARRSKYFAAKGKGFANKAKKFNTYASSLRSVIDGDLSQWQEKMQVILQDARSDMMFKKGGESIKLIINLCNRKEVAVARGVERQRENEAALRRSRTPSPAANNDNSTLVEPVKPEQKNEISDKLLQRIREQIAALNDEIKALKPGCFSLFKSYERKTKIEKLTALNSFFNDSGAFVGRELANQIANEVTKNKRVMRSMKTSRTKDLLTEILNETSDLRPNNDERSSASLLVNPNRK